MSSTESNKNNNNNISTTPLAGKPSLDHIPYTNLTKDEVAVEEELAAKYNVKPYDYKGCIAIACNTMIGTGCFSLPYAFQEAGILLTSFLLFAGSLLCILSGNYMIETLGRLEGLTAAKENEEHLKNDRISMELVSVKKTKEMNETTMSTMHKPQHLITYRKFGYASMCELLCNQYTKALGQSLLLFYIFGSMWAYGSVFPSSVASYLYKLFNPHGSCTPSSSDATVSCMMFFYLSLAVFALVVIYLGLQDLGDQTKLQKILTIYRFVTIGIMILTMSMKLIFENTTNIAAEVPLVNLGKLGKGLGPSFLALGFHFGIPDIIQPLNNKKKTQFSIISAMIIAATLYMMIGVIGALAFGDRADPLVTINWNEYTGCGYGWSKCSSGHTNWFGHIIKIMVLLFPAINVTSAYPVYAVSLGDNILTCLPTTFLSKYSPKFLRLGSRFIAASMPLIMAVLFKKLDMIFTIVGLTGFLIALMIPAYFQRVSILKCIMYWSKLTVEEAANTVYSVRFFSSIRIATFLVFASIVILAISISSIF